MLDVLNGGVDTTQSQLAHGVRLFADHPDQWGLLRARPVARAAGGRRRSLRFEPVAPFTARDACSRTSSTATSMFPAGTVVFACAVERQPRAEGDDGPTSFDITADARRRQAAHVRRRAALLPGREPRARRAAGGPRLPRAADARPRRSTASRSTARSPASTGCSRCRSAGRTCWARHLARRRAV